MATILSEPKFTAASSRMIDTVEQSVRTRVYNLLEDRLRTDHREVITPDDVQECFLQAMREFLDQAR
jgi:protein subunit release factor A